MLWNVETGIKMQYEPGAQGIRGKAVVIVGNTAGLSQATATLLAEQGAMIFFAAASPGELHQTLALVARAGGVARGMVVDLCQPEAVQRFFDQADQWAGPINAVVSYLTMSSEQEGTEPEACQNVVMQEAIRRIGTRSDGQIIYVGPSRNRSSTPGSGMVRSAAVRSTAAALRRQATEMGIRVTLIQPGSDSHSEPGGAEAVLRAEDVAGCVLESLAQPFGVDVIFLPGQLEKQQ